MNEKLPGSPESPDPLDALLRESEVHVPDGGFTARVLLSLPPRRRFSGLRLALFGAALGAGIVILLLHAQSVGEVLNGFSQNARGGDVAGLLPLLPLLIAVGSLVWTMVSLALEEEG